MIYFTQFWLQYVTGTGGDRCWQSPTPVVIGVGSHRRRRRYLFGGTAWAGKKIFGAYVMFFATWVVVEEVESPATLFLVGKMI
ncbi:hypothetical protein HanRHA438_Chr08g0366481 [Helianthus annuus]|nr:hypothetical protein HanHA300_Chr08g0292521 [Helianthus annuus]KAJ0554687.1 hypothetical protein HanHA89_Chr08g0311001 [Helianthus annuus]KAJ0720250.1 hypothetical protein HanLR1_Chr08g0291291 [Helianthus annuus]KAJ0723467.1 hypothetical protein HanOQP8_Chr08g0298681 [Helianthus annuus]KAJ0899262.1 hypothetical protein HanRHA438_Chr08g0366481 [Helianthus annuus]